MTLINKSIMKFEPNKELFGYRSDSQFLIWMKPSEFLDKTPKIIPDYNESSWKRAEIDNLVNKMKEDIPIDPLFLDIDTTNCKVTNHEGRHRALAAEKAGIEIVPVIIYLKNDQGDFISVKEYMKHGCTCNYFDAQKQNRVQ